MPSALHYHLGSAQHEVRALSQRSLCKLPDYCNHTVISKNKLSAHPPPNCLNTEKEALLARLEEELPSENCCVLTQQNPKWDFHFAETPAECPPIVEGVGFQTAGQDGKWTTILVPSNWECEGFGQAIYTNFQYPFKVEVSCSLSIQLLFLESAA